MNNKLYFLIIIFIILFRTNVLSIENKNNIIAKVGNEIITEFEVKNKILTTLFLAKQEITQKNINDLKKQSFELLIQNRLKKIELSKFNFTLEQERVNNYLRSLTSLDNFNFKKQFIKNSLDYDLFIQEIRTELKWQKLIYQTYSKKIKIDEDKIEKEIKELLKKSIYEEYKLSEIEISSTNKNNDDKNISKIKDGILTEGFENSALKFSISNSALEKGNIGWVSSQQLSKRVLDEIKNLEIGKVSNPIKSQNSIIILKLQDKRKSKSSSINTFEIKKKLIDKKKNEMFNLYSRSYISKLKNRTFIKY